MKRVTTIVVLALVVGAMIGIWFATRRTNHVSTKTSPPNSSSPEARPLPEPAAPERRTRDRVGSPAPSEPAAPGPPRGPARDSRSDVAPRTTGEPARAPAVAEAQPGAAAEPARPATPIDPEPAREAAVAPPVPDRAPPAATLEPPRGLEPPPPPPPEPSVASGARPPATTSQLELASVQRVLQRYEEMYDQLDASMAASIWPRMDSGALAKVFARLKRQNLNFDGCAVAVEESRATAHCTGWLTYVPRVGNGALHREHHSWIIEFERAGREWRILQVGAQ